MFGRFLFTVAACLALASQSLMAHDPHDPIMTVVMSPNFNHDSTVFATTDYLSVKLGVYALLKSTNGGITWSPVAGLPNLREMYAVAFSPAYAQDQTLFVAGSGGLFKTTNQGTSWTLASNMSLQTMAVSPNFATDNTLFVVTTQMTLFESTNRGQSFTELTLPASITSTLNAIAVSPNFGTDRTILLGTTSNGIYESTNAGSTWASVTTPQAPPTVNSLVFSPGYSSDRTAFAASNGGVLISTDGGATWSASNANLTDTNVNSVTLSPNYLQDGAIWASTAVGGVFESVNKGGAWSSPYVINRELSNLTTSHYRIVAAGNGFNGVTLVLGTYEGIWTSPSTPLSWKYVDTMPTRLVRHVMISPNYTNDQTVFASTYGGGTVWSTTGAASWAYQNTGMQAPYTDAAAISPNFANDGTAFASVYGVLERTVDHGTSWQPMFGCCVGDATGTGTNVRGMAVSPNFAQDHTVIIGTDNSPNPTFPPYVTYNNKKYPNQGLFLSTDGGNHWIPTSLGGPPIVTVAMSPAFATDRTAFAGTANKGLYKSTDGGMTWTAVTLPSGITQIGVVIFATDQIVFVAPITGGLLKSTNAGSTWTLLPRTSNLLVDDLQLSPNYATDQTLFAGTLQAGVMKSTNGGTTLLPLKAFPDTWATAVAVSPNFTTDQTIFAAAYHSIYKSQDAGVAWTDMIEPGRIEESRTVNGSNSVGQPPPTISYQGSWSSTSNPAASTSAYMTTSTSADTAVLNFTGTGVHWVSTIGPLQGSATVTLDGISQGTINLNQPGTKNTYQQAVWKINGLPCAPHTVTITATPGTGQSVTLDAFDIWINACPESSPNKPPQ